MLLNIYIPTKKVASLAEATFFTLQESLVHKIIKWLQAFIEIIIDCLEKGTRYYSMPVQARMNPVPAE